METVLGIVLGEAVEVGEEAGCFGVCIMSMPDSAISLLIPLVTRCFSGCANRGHIIVSEHWKEKQN